MAATTLLLAAAAALAVAPAAAAGVAAAEAVHRRGLRWTWWVTPAALGALALALLPPDPSVTLRAAEQGDAHAAAAALAPLWVGVAPWAALGWGLWRARRARLHGGERERRAAAARGPLALTRDLRLSRAEADAGRLSGAGVLLGRDDAGRAVRVPMPRAHVTIVGASNSGKTNTAALLLEAQAASGGFVVLDGKGGRELPELAVRLGARHRRRVALWSILPYGDPALDRHRRPWNPAGNATPTEVMDRVAAAEEQTEPYYAAVAARGVLLAAQALRARDEALRLDALARLLDQPGDLRAALHASEPDRHAGEVAWLNGLTEGERSALRGIGVRLHTMVASDGGAALLPAAGGGIDLDAAVRDGWLVVFTLPQGLYPALVPHVTRYALAALATTCGRIERSGVPADAMVFVDELSAFDGDQLCAGLERGRSAGVRFVVATQSLSNFATAGGEKLLHAALDNAELVVVHRQAVPDAAELLASIAGTEEAWEHTHQVADGASALLGLDETGRRARRLTDRFRAHPNVIKRLGLGEAIVVSQRPEFAVRRLRIDRASA